MELCDWTDNEGDIGDDLRREELAKGEYGLHRAVIEATYQRNTEEEGNGNTEGPAGVGLVQDRLLDHGVDTTGDEDFVRRCQHSEICRGDALTYRERSCQPAVDRTKQSDRPIACCLLSVDVGLR